MSDLLENLRTQFAERIVTKGERYYRTGRVELGPGHANAASATVLGTERYPVTLRWRGRTLQGHCTCPYFDRGGLCKHIWATILAAFDVGYLLPGPDDTPFMVPYPQKHDAVPDDDAEDRMDPEPRVRRAATRRPPAGWQTILQPSSFSNPVAPAPPARDRVVYYALRLGVLKQHGQIQLQILQRLRKRSGDWGKAKPFSPTGSDVGRLADSLDRQILLTLRGGAEIYSYGWKSSTSGSEYVLDESLWLHLLPLLCATGRFTTNGAEPAQGPFFTLDEGPPWALHIRVEEATRDALRVCGILRRGADEIPLEQPTCLLNDGWLFLDNRIARFDHQGAFRWALLLREHGGITVPRAEAESFLDAVLALPAPAPLELPPDLALTEQAASCTPQMVLRAARHEPDLLIGQLSFDYLGRSFREDDTDQGYRPPGTRHVIRRNPVREAAARDLFRSVGARERRHLHSDHDFRYELPINRLSEAMRVLATHGWRIKFKGKSIRAQGRLDLAVTSGVDWFDLSGSVDFEGVRVELPVLLKAIREQQGTIVLADGSLGILPNDWTRRLASLAALAGEAQDGLRFSRAQTPLLDVLLAQQDVRVDETFARARAELQSFRSIVPADPPDSFRGTLRDYQRDGLGWFAFLQRFGFGGCLADDMGLGKTVQVLALLEARRLAQAGPSLVVAPKSVVFNWKSEAARFVPQLRVLEHTGIARARSTGHLKDYDLILTTYGTLRQDVPLMKGATFDYVILDEAQAIKNAATASAKAARLLNARHRLALSGTPIENHLGELWSLFEFLNPGLLGRASYLQAMGAGRTEADDATRAVLAQALRPFILRRTKKEVASELPERTEDTLWCELPPTQRKLYDELREHYRASLLGAVDKQGLNRSKIQVLEALLRLRQAACHPALLDAKLRKAESAKLDALLPQLVAVVAEGHKALVFSQFTSFLALLKPRLDEQELVYEYLDGKTRDRQARVERFQSDPDCRLFLISLKAGGLGLNLTAAEYVFLLDPWWNPAVEAQAIDRAHRIGQTRQVLAYRLIAKDTIEEKVLELQKSKRALADAIISADSSLLRTLTREDLELLLT